MTGTAVGSRAGSQPIRDVFLRGISTREVGRVLDTMLGERVSAATVSRVARSLDAEVQRFHPAATHRQLTVPLPGRRLLAREGGAAGVPEIRALRPLRDRRRWPRKRGLTDQALKLVATDGCTGLHAALQAVYPFVPSATC